MTSAKSQLSNSTKTADLKKQVAVLQKEVSDLNKKLNAEKKNHDGSGKIKNTLRKSIIVFLIVLTGLFMNFGVSSIWLRRNVTDTDSWVKKTTLLIEDPAIRARISSVIASEIFDKADVQSQVKQILPERINGLSAPITQSMQDFTSNKVDQALQSEEFKEFWAKTNRSAHQGIIQSLENSGNATIESKKNLMYIDQDNLILNLAPVFASIQTKLSNAGLEFVDKINSERFEKTIVVTEVENMSSVLMVFNAVNRFAILIPMLAIISAVVSLALSTDKRRTLMAIGIVTGLFMVLNVQLVYLAKYPIVSKITESLQSDGSGAALATFDIITKDLVLMSQALLTISIILVLVTFLSGPARIAVWIRQKAGKLFVFNKVDAPTPKWIAKNAYSIAVGCGVVAVGLVLFPLVKGPTYAVIVVTSASLLAFIALSIRQASPNSGK